MYFDFEDQRPDVPGIESAFTIRDGVLLSLVVHGLIALAVAFAPRVLLRHAAVPVQLAQADQQKSKESIRFVFVQPQVDRPALKPPPNAPASDLNREARSPIKPPQPENAQPFMRGNTPDKVEQRPGDESIPRGRGNTPEPADANAPAQAAASPSSPPTPESQIASISPQANRPAYSPPSSGGRSSGGSLGDSLRNLQRYVQGSQFDNQKGGGQFGSDLQFDTKGVEFGPWVRRFKALVQRNWEPLIPDAPMAMRMQGRVVITLNIHKDGTITDVRVLSPCPIDGYNTAAFGALRASNPTPPLPPEYPDEHAFFTVTFYYNERPPE
jgi:TonB family protein